MKFKKYLLYIVVGVVTFLIIFGAMYLFELYKADRAVKKFDKAFASSEKQMIFYARKTCYYCQLQKPILKNIAKDYDIDYLSIDGDSLNKKQKKHIIDTLNTEDATPITAIVQNKKVLAIHVGYLDGKEYVDFLKEADMLPKDAVYNQEKYLNFITYNDYKDIDDGILVLGMNASPDCIDLRSSLNSIAKNNKYTINYINLSRGTADQYYELVDYLVEINVHNFEILEDDDLIVPLVYVIKDHKIVDVIDSKDESKIETELKKYMK